MTIYDTIGGAPAVAAAVDDFYVRVTSDPELAGYFEGTDMRKLKSHQRTFIAAAIGGPEKYVGKSMAQAHARLNIVPSHFDLVVGHLVDTLASLGVPEHVIGQIGATLAPLKDEIAPGPSTQAG
ncbi:group I truncated hemoglobin [Gordonia hydrophobica]|uniref:Group 1 truncated hemoglobin n=1 Tax=Gordonia hydrophobica TaxID=40516 RepID=A0ABZ2TZ39_9ACTN|nr:group 1 truncated hemoglobin [Gordonia hydrophobica]MBM7367227.1 hemoglobin [Gordonia hydrophobica]